MRSLKGVSGFATNQTNASRDASLKKLLNFELKVFMEMHLRTHPIVDIEMDIQIKC